MYILNFCIGILCDMIFFVFLRYLAVCNKKNIFFTCSFLEIKKKLIGLKGIFLKKHPKKLKKTKKKQKSDFMLFFLYTIILLFFFCCVKPNRLTRLDRPSWVWPDWVTQPRQLRNKSKRKQEQNRSKVAKTLKLQWNQQKTDQNRKDKTK